MRFGSAPSEVFRPIGGPPLITRRPMRPWLSWVANPDAVSFILKGQSREIFDLRIFSLNYRLVPLEVPTLELFSIFMEIFNFEMDSPV